MSWSSRNNIVKQWHTAHQEIYDQWTQFCNFEPRICTQNLHVIPDFWTFCVLWLVFSHEAFGSMHFFFPINPPLTWMWCSSWKFFYKLVYIWIVDGVQYDCGFTAVNYLMFSPSCYDWKSSRRSNEISFGIWWAINSK